MIRKILNYRHNFYHDRVGKIRILTNALVCLFLMAAGKRLVVKNFFGYKFLLDLGIPGISKVIFIYGIREVLDTDLVLQELSANMNVLDIGGNIGYYALLEASKIKTGKIYAVEPDPRNLVLLRKNIAINNLSDKVIIYPYALGNKNEKCKLYLAKEPNLNTVLSGTAGNRLEAKYIETNMVKVDDFEHIYDVDFIRMDVEGYECFLLDGAMEFLQKTDAVKLLIEVHPRYYDDNGLDFTKRLKNLAQAGFKVPYMISEGSACPEEITARGYRPIKTARELKVERGLYENIAMEDLIDFLKGRKEIVRTILLEKRG